MDRVLVTIIINKMLSLSLAANAFPDPEGEMSVYIEDVGDPGYRIGDSRWYPIGNGSYANRCGEILFNQAVTNSRLHIDYLPNNTLVAAADYMRVIGRPIIYFVGLFFNVLGMCVLLRRELRRVATCNIMTALAVADCCILINGFFFWIEYELLYPGMTASRGLCGLTVFTVYFAPEMSACMIILMSGERLLRHINTPKHEVIFSTKKTRIYIVAIVVFLLILNIPIPLFDIYFYECGRQICWNIFHDSPELLEIHNHNAAEEGDYYSVYRWVALVIYWIIPLVGLPVINARLIYAIWKDNKKKGSQVLESTIPTPGSGLHRDWLVEEQKSVTRMLISVTVAYWIMTTGFNLIQADIIDIYRNTTDYERAKFSMIYTVFILLFYMNHASNFFLYCLSARPYREELKAMWVDIKECIYTKRETEGARRSHVLGRASSYGSLNQLVGNQEV
ncbi:uncharacterized protein LOC106178726 [Lingula anatina]|uniref:Uncharacterized protein LOC106178726 n=1 Tax=Lingula anatina TaxID=7574 RepID=A0A1S3K4N5_LINAN|nr:uncharacterized protein LOC106178726 [Lingula anatina]XP_013417479.1 uncharacterized protein LOC106178726 [Lingula anatina]XP_013417481.1 uncharacterized protein LOC106178726 [Lingula anatina]XP_013417482.1 uncharacterized protein LOC106178726 [Lingula anatina]|eukprot:XP_013417478.1 uncharacterized protein LOC106178726 [Lingula anatina]